MIRAALLSRAVETRAETGNLIDDWWRWIVETISRHGFDGKANKPRTVFGQDVGQTAAPIGLAPEMRCVGETSGSCQTNKVRL